MVWALKSLKQWIIFMVSRSISMGIYLLLVVAGIAHAPYLYDGRRVMLPSLLALLLSVTEFLALPRAVVRDW